MEFSDLIEKRYSVRKFKDKAVEKELVDKILKAGHIAPTGCNKQPQRILVINEKETLEKLKKCTRCHFDAPCAMLVCFDKTDCWQRPYDGALCGGVDASIVTTHMMLAAADIGVGTTWVMHFNPEKMREEFKLPENFVPVSLLVMGYAADDAEPSPSHSEIRPIEETVFYNHF